MEKTTVRTMYSNQNEIEMNERNNVMKAMRASYSIMTVCKVIRINISRVEVA